MISCSAHFTAEPATNYKGTRGQSIKGLFSDDSQCRFVSGKLNLWPRSVIGQLACGRHGRFIVYRKHNGKTGVDIELLPLASDRQPRSYSATPFIETYGDVSPDGRWLAYQTNDSGRLEIYVQSFPEPGRKARVSKGGGQLYAWRTKMWSQKKKQPRMNTDEHGWGLASYLC